MGNFSGYGKAEFGDERLNTRLPRLIEQLIRDPGASVLAACQDPYQAKAAYRFVGNDGVTVDEITRVTREVTIANISAAKPSVLLIPQDTSELNYSNLKATEGLGNIARKRASMGIIIHTGIAVEDTGMVHGLLWQKIWIRPPEEHNKAENRKSLPIEEKESFKWLETIEKVGTDFPEGTLVVHVCDREGDIYELFCKAEKEGANYLCRRFQPRKTQGEDGNESLEGFVDALPAAGSVIVNVPRDSHTGRLARDAVLEVKYGKCSIAKPGNLPASRGLPSSVGAYVVSASEKDPPEGQEKIFWHLITNVPVASFEDAVTRIQWYTQRWKIELFHRTLKSGCKVEELQSESADKLMKLIAIYSIIALQIMLLGYMARADPDASCENCLEEEEWKILYRVANKTKSLPDKPPTIHEAVAMKAKLGGFPGRKSDGKPGVTVIWRGLSKLYTILDAVPFFA